LSLVADAGFLVDFPLRLLFALRMVVSEIVVWVIAILINIIALMYVRECYKTTTLTQLIESILTTPIPYRVIIFLSGIGAFLFVRFGDELIDELHQKDGLFSTSSL
jgi:hypothetical protein